MMPVQIRIQDGIIRKSNKRSLPNSLPGKVTEVVTLPGTDGSNHQKVTFLHQYNFYEFCNINGFCVHTFSPNPIFPITLSSLLSIILSIFKSITHLRETLFDSQGWPQSLNELPSERNLCFQECVCVYVYMCVNERCKGREEV